MWCVRHYLVTPARTSAITLENATDPMPWMAQDTKKYTHNNNEINYNINNDNNRIKEKWDRCFTFYTTILARLYIKTHLYLSLSCLLSFALNAWHCCPFACIIFYSTLCNRWNVWLLLFYAQRIHLILSEHTQKLNETKQNEQVFYAHFENSINFRFCFRCFHGPRASAYYWCNTCKSVSKGRMAAN